MLTENRGFCEFLARPSSETAFCCPYMDRSSANIYIYTYIYIYIYIWTLIITDTIVAMLFCGSTHNTPCCYVFYSWLMLLCCNYSGHKTRYDRDNNIPSEPSPAPTPPTRSRVQRKRSRCQPRLYKPSPGTRVSDHLRPSDRGLITHLDEDGFRARVWITTNT